MAESRAQAQTWSGQRIWLWVAAMMTSAGSLIAFGLSRTVGLFGFIERGWEPAPHAVISAVAELVTLGVFFAAVLRLRRSPGLG